MRNPEHTIAAIDVALQKALDDRLPNLSVTLDPRLYQDLLDLKGLDWQLTDMSYDAKHDDRPLKMYRGYPLILANATGSGVYGRMPDGSIRGWAVWVP